MRLFARQAFLPDGWAPDVLLDLAPDGTILTVSAAAEPGDALILEGPVVPGIANLHSHAFQRAMAGGAERRERAGDNFWSWREAMYGLAARIDPDELYALARSVYRAMLAAGYTSVAEFHYLHRDPHGAWYADRPAMARALIAAAKDAGITICLLPALYAHGDAGGAPLASQQRRFASSVDEVLALAASLSTEYEHDPDVVVGVCAHSLRAVTPDELRALIDGSPRDVPIHLHVAEQPREVAAVEAALGARPLAWLLENHDVDARWCLIHATQIDAREREGLARSGAVAGLCPTTEANLGDGLFPLEPFLVAGGRFGIGSDSNVTLAPAEELRWLEYGQRLVTGRRLIAAHELGASCGEVLYAGAARGGAQACGRAAGAIVPGMRADLVVLDEDDPTLMPARPETLLDRFVFVSGAAPRAVFVGGRRRAPLE